MVAHVATVAFLGLEARAVEVQVQIASGLPKFLRSDAKSVSSHQ
jgi:magnesium chelatase family protein